MSQNSPNKESLRKESVPFSIEDSTGYLVNAAARLFARALHQRIMREGIPIGQWPFLMFLWEEEGLSQTDLSRRVGIDETTAVRTLDRMERDGLIRREADGKDRRRRKIVLTEKGRALRNPLIPCAIEVNSLATAGWTEDERSAFHNSLKNAIKNLLVDLESVSSDPSRGTMV